MSKRIRSLLILHDRNAVAVFFFGGGMEIREISRRHYERLVTLWHVVCRSYAPQRRLHATFAKKAVADLRISRRGGFPE